MGLSATRAVEQDRQQQSMLDPAEIEERFPSLTSESAKRTLHDA
jgi:hypothetical protein